MTTTTYPHVNEFIEKILSGLQSALHEKLVGLYLYGSLVIGDFDTDISDIDLLAVLSSPLEDTEFLALDAMQNSLVQSYPQWKDRLEIAYLTQLALDTFKTQSSQIAVISPGEDFHYKEAGKDWLMNWYMVRERGISLFGSAPQAIIPDISQAEFILCVKEHVIAWGQWIQEFGLDSRPSQAYVILTMCRGLYTLKHGEQLSKLQAANWAQQEFPQWANLIQNALLWRRTWREQGIDPSLTVEETRRYVYFAIDSALK